MSHDQQSLSPGGPAHLMPPPGGAIVRMYRIGHGDCFLLAFAGEEVTRPVYVLVDCGYKPGSPKYLKTKTSSAEIGESIREATGGHIDVVVITHEHQDHVNGFTETNFEGITVGEAWFAWTEDPEDDLARAIRKKYKDKLLGLLSARNQLAIAGDGKLVNRIDDLLAFELGGTDEEPFAVTRAAAMLGAAASGVSMNKNSMKLVKDRAKNGVRFIRPHEPAFDVPGTKSVRVFALGPPRDTELLKSLDPQGSEEFHLASASRSASGYFAAAAQAMEQNLELDPPFAWRYCVSLQALQHADQRDVAFLEKRYGLSESALETSQRELEVPSNVAWRRIDHEWLSAAENLAIDMNDQTNNSSLALAFELEKGGKVLLFAADAQRGNWLSWARRDWKDGEKQVTAKNLLARTVLYKVGHHGSHNATLNGDLEDLTPSLTWMAQGTNAREFTAMITAVRDWAETQKGWDHPLKAIKDALLKKCSGRVLQTDTDLEAMAPPADALDVDWKAFQQRIKGDRLFFDYVIEP